jgi:hypothetical protein
MGCLCDSSLLSIAETRSSMHAKRDVTMRVAVLLIACLVFCRRARALRAGHSGRVRDGRRVAPDAGSVSPSGFPRGCRGHR